MCVDPNCIGGVCVCGCVRKDCRDAVLVSGIGVGREWRECATGVRPSK